MRKKDGAIFVPGGLMMADLPSGLTLDWRFKIDAPMKYLTLLPIDQELLTFLKASIPGAKGVIATLELAI
jgi:hypothetical protein